MDKGIKIAILVACMSLFVVLGLGSERIPFGLRPDEYPLQHLARPCGL